MKTTTCTRFNLLAWLLAACLLVPGFAQAQDAIGRVIRTAGVVNAIDTAGAERPLARGSEVFMNEIIVTGPRGSTQLRLTDGAVISLEADSEFSVDDYEFDGAGGAADSVIMTMARGTMRTLTGAIGDDPADTYTLNTPFASIGVRGTEYGVVVDNNGRVRVIVFDGSISVAPVAPGTIPVIVGLEGDADVVDVADNATVVALEDVPPEVQAIVRIVTEAVSDAEVARLPPPEQAVQIQRALDQRGQEQQQQQQQEEQPGGRDAAGTLVDADGNAQVVRNDSELNNARAVVVITVSENDPNAFDPETRRSASPN